MSGGNGGLKRIDSAAVARWHERRFGAGADPLLVALKVVEEVGEIAGAIVKRAEGARRPEKGLVTREDWTRHLRAEIGDAVITLHMLAVIEGRDLYEMADERFVEVSARAGAEVRRFAVGERVRSVPDGAEWLVAEPPPGTFTRGDEVWVRNVEDVDATGPVGILRAEALELVSRLDEFAGLGGCRSCGQPFRPTHDIRSPGPTVRHPFIPLTHAPGARERAEGRG